jgi:hypothetical protein
MKVLIAAPIGGHKQYSINQWFHWIANQDHKDYEIAVCANGDTAPELVKLLEQVEIVDKHGQQKKITSMSLPNEINLSTIQRITYSREKLRRYALAEGYDYLFFSDTDTIPLVNDAIPRLLSHKLDAVSGVYFYKNSKVPVVVDKTTSTNIALDKIKQNALSGTLAEIWGAGFGCIMLSKRTLAECAFNYDLFGEDRTDDFGYCHVVQQKGIKIWLDSRVICKHLANPETDNFKKLNDLIHFRQQHGYNPKAISNGQGKN